MRAPNSSPARNDRPVLLVPLKDDNPTRRFAALTAAFVALNAAVFAILTFAEP